VETLLPDSKSGVQEDVQLLVHESPDKRVERSNLNLQVKGQADVDGNSCTFRGGDSLVWIKEPLTGNFELQLRVLKVQQPEKLVF